MEFDDSVEKLREGKTFIQDLVDNKRQVIDPQAPERRASVVSLLEVLESRTTRRGGPSRPLLLELSTLIPGESTLSQTSLKLEIVRDLLKRLRETRVENEGETQGNAVGEPQGPAPEGWGSYLPPTTPVVPSQPSSLLRLRRGELSEKSNQEILQLLLKEQDRLLSFKKKANDNEFLRFLRSNLQSMTGNTAPLPDTTSDAWVVYIYEQELKKQVEKTTKLAQQEVGGRGNPLVLGGHEEEGSSSAFDQQTSSESDIESYFPKKRFAITMKFKGKRKRKRHRKKSKKRKKKSRSRVSSDSEESDSSSSSEDEQPNGRRVKKGKYGPNHYEQLQEFREDYASYVEDGNKMVFHQ